MKQLFLLRHAQAASSHGGQDIERDLTPQGLAEAQNLGAYMAGQNHVPDLILCSSANRTRQTCAGLLKGFGQHPETQFSEEIYNAPYHTLLSLIQATNENIQNLMLIGHNPSIYECAARLSSAGDEKILDRLSQGFPPATLCVIKADCANWADLNEEGNTLIDLKRTMDNAS